MITPNDFDSLLELVEYFKDEQTAIDYLTLKRWNGAVSCPHCGHDKVYKFSDNRRYKCSSCREQFTAKVGTIFESSKIPLRKWFIAIYLITSHKKGISSHQLGRDLKITQKSAWFMLMRIRHILFNDSEISSGVHTGLVEVDETYVGADNRNKSNSKRKKLHENGKQTGGNHKVPVLGILERGGELKAVVLQKAHGKTIKPILSQTIDVSATVITDGFGAYAGIDKTFSGHKMVRHDKSQYVSGIYHTNNIEGFWSLFKRAITGIYHSASPQHLQKYVDESAFRYNTRKFGEGERINYMLTKVEARLRYGDLIKKDEGK